VSVARIRRRGDPHSRSNGVGRRRLLGYGAALYCNPACVSGARNALASDRAQQLHQIRRDRALGLPGPRDSHRPRAFKSIGHRPSIQAARHGDALSLDDEVATAPHVYEYLLREYCVGERVAAELIATNLRSLWSAVGPRRTHDVGDELAQGANLKART
jgi:hypothetical protein